MSIPSLGNNGSPGVTAHSWAAVFVSRLERLKHVGWGVGIVVGNVMMSLLPIVAAPIVYPDTGTSVPLYFAWRSSSDPDPSAIDHTDWFELQATPIFGDEQWQDVPPSALPFANVCVSWRNVYDELIQRCWTFMDDRRMRYRVRSCGEGELCRSWVEQSAWNWLRCCRSDDTCYGGLAVVPAGCA